MSGQARRPTSVIKVGGEVVMGAQVNALGEGLLRLHEKGERLMVVHGGGPQLSALQKALGVPVRQVGGRRFTDEATLDALKMAVCGKVSVDLCAALRRHGLRPVGLASAIFAERRPPRVYPGAGAEPLDLGLVGDVTGFDRELIELLWQDGRVPVVASLGIGEGTAGGIYNINADTVARQLARRLPAERLVLMSSVPVLRDMSDPSSRIPALTPCEARALIEQGVVSGGMVAKLDEACASLGDGIAEVVITADLCENSTVLHAD